MPISLSANHRAILNIGDNGFLKLAFLVETHVNDNAHRIATVTGVLVGCIHDVSRLAGQMLQVGGLNSETNMWGVAKVVFKSDGGWGVR